MDQASLAEIYQDYIACLNRQDWPSLGRFVHADVRYNGEVVGLDGYRGMLERNFEQIPDLRFTVELLISEADDLAARLVFDCRPTGEFLGLPVNGRRVVFAENVFYRFRDRRIAEVLSVIDKAAVEAQL